MRIFVYPIGNADRLVQRLLYRAWQVCQTSNEVLVEKLGLDIPPSPEVTLEEVTAHDIHIAWKQPDFHNSIHKHIIQVNGTKGSQYPLIAIVAYPWSCACRKLISTSGRIKTGRDSSRNP